jgi:hypothetical protein
MQKSGMGKQQASVTFCWKNRQNPRGICEGTHYEENKCVDVALHRLCQWQHEQSHLWRNTFRGKQVWGRSNGSRRHSIYTSFCISTQLASMELKVFTWTTCMIHHTLLSLKIKLKRRTYTAHNLSLNLVSRLDVCRKSSCVPQKMWLWLLLALLTHRQRFTWSACQQGLTAAFCLAAWYTERCSLCAWRMLLKRVFKHIQCSPSVASQLGLPMTAGKSWINA